MLLMEDDHKNVPASGAALCWSPCNKPAVSGHSWRTVIVWFSSNFGLYHWKK